MPCNSDYMNPTETEKYQKRTAILLVYVLKKLGKKVPPELKKKADDYYGHGKDITPELCGELRKMDNETIDRVVYDGRNKTARDLADWWEDHQEVDRRREAKEKAETKKQKLVDQAKAKLTSAERKALGI